MTRIHTRSAFTLIELLVVFAVVAVLTGIVVPAASRARDAARHVREVAAGQQLIIAYSLYAEDHKGNVLVGYATAAMTDSATPDNQALIVQDQTGERIFGVPARRYPWRIAPYFDGAFEAMYKDPSLLSRYRERPDFQYVASLSPSFGLNSAFVGGDADRFGFNSAALKNWGSFYITRIDQPRRADNLLVFVTAHGANPDGPDPVPGYFRVDAPRRLARVWNSTIDLSTLNRTPAAAGNVDFRHAGRAAGTLFDGHTQTYTPTALDDMRLWSNQAGSPDWQLGNSR